MAGAVLGDKYLSQVCGIVVTDNTNAVQSAAYTLGVAAIKAGAAAWQLAHPSSSAPMETESEAAHFAWAFVYPPDVCDFMPPLSASGGGIYYPHPLSSFSNQIRLYLLAVNGATILAVLAVSCTASKLRTAYLSQANMHTARPLAYATMP